MQLAEKQKTKPDPWNRGCPSRAVLNIIGDKWTMLLFPLLQDGPRRNSELLRLLDGISQKVLTETLRDLEGHGLVARRDYGTVPPKVDYRLTELGATLAEAMRAVDQWVVDHYLEVAEARTRFLRKAKRKERAGN
jgi:DNA-binding HxlR family transcriptional regulator